MSFFKKNKNKDNMNETDKDDIYYRYSDYKKSNYSRDNFSEFNMDDIEGLFEEYYKQIFNGRSNYRSNYNNHSYVNKNTTSDLDNAYKLMKLEKTVDETTIKKKYRELSMIWHPDKWSTNTKENQEIAGRNFIKLNNAYELIKKHKNIN